MWVECVSVNSETAQYTDRWGEVGSRTLASLWLERQQPIHAGADWRSSGEWAISGLQKPPSRCGLTGSPLCCGEIRCSFFCERPQANRTPSFCFCWALGSSLQALYWMQSTGSLVVRVWLWRDVSGSTISRSLRGSWRSFYFPAQPFLKLSSFYLRKIKGK